MTKRPVAIETVTSQPEHYPSPGQTSHDSGTIPKVTSEETIQPRRVTVVKEEYQRVAIAIEPLSGDDKSDSVFVSQLGTYHRIIAITGDSLYSPPNSRMEMAVLVAATWRDRTFYISPALLQSEIGLAILLSTTDKNTPK